LLRQAPISGEIYPGREVAGLWRRSWSSAPWEWWVCAPPAPSQRRGESPMGSGLLRPCWLSRSPQQSAAVGASPYDESLCAALPADGFPRPAPFPSSGGSGSPHAPLVRVLPLLASTSIPLPGLLCQPRPSLLFVSPVSPHSIFLPPAHFITLPPFSSSFPILIFSGGLDRAQH